MELPSTPLVVWGYGQGAGFEEKGNVKIYLILRQDILYWSIMFCFVSCALVAIYFEN